MHAPSPPAPDPRKAARSRLLASRRRALLAACAGLAGVAGAAATLAASLVAAPYAATVFFAVLAGGLGLGLGALLVREVVVHERERDRFDDFSRATADWFWEMDQDLRFTYLSPGVHRSGARAEHLLGRTPRDISPTAATAEDWQAHLADLEARRPFRDFRLALVDLSGRPRHLSVSGSPVFDRLGRFRGYRGAAREVSAEIEREQRSRSLERRLFDAIETFPEAIILWDAEDRLVHANSQFGKLVGPLAEYAKPGVTFEELLRRAVELGVFLAPERQEEEEYITRRLAEHRSPAAPTEHALADGRWRLITERLTAEGGVLTIYTDITAQKQAQLAAQAAAAAVAEKQRQLDIALDNIAQGIALFDPEQRLVVANRRYRDLFRLPAALIRPGVTLREIMEHSVRQGNYRPETATRVVEERLAFSQGRERAVAQQRLADGRIVELVHQPLPDGGAVVTFTDVTEREHASHALLAAKDAAESANQAKSRFLAKMSHELRTPLNAVLGFSEIIRDMAFGRDAMDKYADYARDIHFSGEHLLRVINDILDMSKIEAGQTELSDEFIDVGEQIGHALGMVANSARAAHVTLTADLPPQLPGLRADRRLLLQVLLNLLSNAVKFSRGGGQVIVGGRITEDRALEICVVDSGIGIAPADQARIFEPFFQAASHGQLTPEGTGLGLSISKSIMELHGGSIRIDSGIGRGTRAVIRFPAERISAA